MDLRRLVAAEAIGTAFLVAAVVGSGLMAERLTDDTALALLCNSIATGAMLVVLISILGPVSGAHLNPAVTAVMALRGELSARHAAFYMLAQVGGGLIGTLAVHLMFDVAALQVSSTVRTGAALWFAEAVAAFGLTAVILMGDRRSLPWLVGLYIVAAYWFTASTSFANPAVTIARSLTESFAGIRPIDAPAFIAAQFLGAALAFACVRWLSMSEPAGRSGAP